MWQSVSLVLSWNSWTMAKAFGGQPLFFSGRNTAIVFNLTQRIGQFFTPLSLLKILSFPLVSYSFPRFPYSDFVKLFFRQSDLNHQNSTDIDRNKIIVFQKKGQVSATFLIIIIVCCLHCITEKKVETDSKIFEPT